MSLLVVGVNHRSGPLSLLERLTIAPDDLPKAVSGLAQRDTIREAVVLSTCNRTEVYVIAERFHGAYADAQEFLCELGELDLDALTPHLFSQHDDAAVTHLFDVAAGLDSAVIGEGEILGQIRTAWQVALDESAARSGMNLLMRSAVETGKRARTETAIGRGTASVSHAAVEMLGDVVGDLGGLNVAVIGAGSMGEGVAVALHKAGGADICVVNRSPERGAALAQRVGGSASGFDRLDAALSAADVVVASTGSGEPVITVDKLRNARGDSARPLHIIDIAVPRDVEPDVAELDGVTVLDLDDLRDWADRGRALRAKEAALVRRIVAEEVDNFAIEQTSRQAAPLVASMRRAADEVRTSELERFAGRLAELSDSDRDAVDALTKAIVSKLLHEPSVRLKLGAGTPQGDRNAAAVRDLFDLG
ncbi:glutamyl-tRNA reductase [Ilumatobacter nonamiensis]|uniref:glutamyl-tRNA reductase n=1 Tax=Ilumatobacter nonamiensis TaxID=467093 RepID=UPI0003472657|nr:glutamyl-tRNA reductase [Ilumatobacter nonamiensis]